MATAKAVNSMIAAHGTKVGERRARQVAKIVPSRPMIGPVTIGRIVRPGME